MEEDDDELTADVHGQDVAAAVAHIAAARLLATPTPPSQHKIAQLEKPYRTRRVWWRRRVVRGMILLGSYALVAILFGLPGISAASVALLITSITAALLVVSELLAGSGIEVEEQFVTTGEQRRYDRFNSFIPSIRSLPKLVLLLAAIATGFIVGFGGLFATIEAYAPGAFAKGHEAWLYFSVVTFATVGYGDMAPVSALARGAVVAEIAIAMAFNAVVLSTTISWLVSDARSRREARDRARLRHMRRRDQWIKDSKLGLYAEPGAMDALIADAEMAAKATTEEPAAPAKATAADPQVRGDSGDTPKGDSAQKK
jgi:hypothetical protein